MYTFEGRVGYSEAASDGLIGIAAIVNHMQNTSSYEYYDLGTSFDILRELNQAWILNAWQIVFKKRPKVYEAIKVHTWAYDYSDVFGYRNYVMENGNGEVCAYANSVWVMTDPKTGRLTKAIERSRAGFSGEPRFEMDYKDRKIIMPKNMEEIETFYVKRDQLDTHLHVNNVKYIEMALQYMPQDFQLEELRIQYIRPAILGDRITVKILEQDSKLYISLDSDEGKPFATLELS